MDYESRLKRAREAMNERNIGLMYLTHGANLWYLAGIQRSPEGLTDHNRYGDYICGAYIGTDGGFTLIAPRMGRNFYLNEAESKPWIDSVRVIDESERPEVVLHEVIKSFGLKNKGISLDNHACAESVLTFRQVLCDNPFSIASDIITPMRMIKDDDEIAVMRKAGEITDEVYNSVLKFIKVGMTEYDIAYEIDHQFSKRGVDYPSFITGIKFTRPGGTLLKVGSTRATADILREGDSITFDFGACYQGYCSDFGRTAFTGEPPVELQKAYRFMIEAQETAIKAMVGGTITAMQLDKVARGIIDRAGYGHRFTHRLGHGIGVTVHEPPYLYQPDDTLLVSGMTMTVEPSITLPDSYGCRVEDVVVVTEDGGLPLTNFHKEIVVI